MGLQTSEPSPPDETKVLPPGFNHFVTCPDRNQQGDVILDDTEDYSSVWESLPASSRPVSGALRPEWEADGELATSFEWQRHLEGDKDRDSASGTMPKSPGPGQIHSYSSVFAVSTDVQFPKIFPREFNLDIILTLSWFLFLEKEKKTYRGMPGKCYKRTEKYFL